MSTTNDFATGTSQQELVITRTFDAPRELVFKAWTEPERLAQWWGPKDFVMGVVSIDLRLGGMFHYSMRTPEGLEMWGKFIYREIVPPERLAFVVSFADRDGNTVRAPWDSNWPLEVLSTLTFTEHDGKTTIVMRGIPVNATETELNIFEATHASMQQGWGGTLDQLADYLATA
jgi:uncharacterized protein YndB with AHSA1/START domain